MFQQGFPNLKKLMPNILLAKKITCNPHMVSKHGIAYKLFVIIQQMCYSSS